MSLNHELDAPPWLRVESTIMATARQIRCLYDLRFAELGLNLSQASLLAYCCEFGPNTQTALAGRMGLGRAATGTVIDQLEARSLVRRMPDPQDRRVWLISLSDQGKRIVERISEIDSVVRKDLRIGITRQERQQLASLLVRIQQNLTVGLNQTDGRHQTVDPQAMAQADGPSSP